MKNPSFGIIGLLVLTALSAPLLARGPAPSTAVPQYAVTHATETARIRAHLEATEAALRAADVSHLNEAQRAARARHLDVLREYRDAGEFPHNHDFRGERRPYFVDAHGTLCAMAYLIARSGRPDLVRAVQRAENNAYIRDLADEPALLAWLDSAGLGVAEAARIQPDYGWTRHESDVHRDYTTMTTAFGAISGGVAVWNLMSDREDGWWLPGVAGVTMGGADLILAFYGMTRSSVDEAVEHEHIALNALLGGITTALGVRTLILGRSEEPERAAGEAAARLELQPYLARDTRAPGLGMTLRF